MEDKKPQVDLHVRLPKDLHDWLQKVAAAERRSLNNLLVVLLDAIKRERGGD